MESVGPQHSFKHASSRGGGGSGGREGSTENQREHEVGGTVTVEIRWVEEEGEGGGWEGITDRGGGAGGDGGLGVVASI